MRIPHFAGLLTLAGLCAVPATAQFPGSKTSSAPSRPLLTPHDSRFQLPAFHTRDRFISATQVSPVLLAQLRAMVQKVTPNDLRNNSLCYVIESHQFPGPSQNFNPSVASTNATCLPAAQYRMKSAAAAAAK